MENFVIDEPVQDALSLDVVLLRFRSHLSRQAAPHAVAGSSNLQPDPLGKLISATIHATDLFCRCTRRPAAAEPDMQSKT